MDDKELTPEEQFKPECYAWQRLRGDEAELIYVATFYGLPIFVGVRHSVQKEVELRYVIRDLESLIERPMADGSGYAMPEEGKKHE